MKKTRGGYKLENDFFCSECRVFFSPNTARQNHYTCPRCRNGLIKKAIKRQPVLKMAWRKKGGKTLGEKQQEREAAVK